MSEMLEHPSGCDLIVGHETRSLEATSKKKLSGPRRNARNRKVTTHEATV